MYLVASFPGEPKNEEAIPAWEQGYFPVRLSTEPRPVVHVQSALFIQRQRSNKVDHLFDYSTANNKKHLSKRVPWAYM